MDTGDGEVGHIWPRMPIAGEENLSIGIERDLPRLSKSLHSRHVNAEFHDEAFSFSAANATSILTKRAFGGTEGDNTLNLKREIAGASKVRPLADIHVPRRNLLSTNAGNREWRKPIFPPARDGAAC